MTVKFKPYHRGAVPDSRDVPPLDPFDKHNGYSFKCPKCSFEYVHVEGAQLVEGPYDGRPAAEISLSCESGCLTTLIFGNYKGWGYCHWVDEGVWEDVISPRISLSGDTPVNGSLRQRGTGSWERNLMSVGMECFVTYFELFNSCNLSNRDIAEQIFRDRDYTWKSCQSRTSKARSIIRAGRTRDALEKIITSNRVSEQTRNKATRIWNHA